MEHANQGQASSSVAMLAGSLLRAVVDAGNCSHPIRLRGETLNLATGEVRPSKLRIACKDRREIICSACSYLYRADAWILVAAGLGGGKGVPESVKEHPRLFVTLTAPSFGAVHRRTKSGDCHRWSYGRCEHGNFLVCRSRHDDANPRLGTPLCGACFDYEGAILWNAHVAQLWNRTVQQLRREIGHDKLSYLKVAEFQARGLVHLHSILRLDSIGDDVSPPEDSPEASELIAIVARTLSSVHWTNSLGERYVWGEQFDISQLRSEQSDERRVASYVAGYATKTTDGSMALARRFHSREEIMSSRLSTHYRQLALTAWDLANDVRYAHLGLDTYAHAFGYRGQLITKSRRYSTTFAELREARALFMAKDNDGDPVVGSYVYDGRGYDDPRAAQLAEFFHKGKVELRQQARARRIAESASEALRTNEVG